MKKLFFAILMCGCCGILTVSAQHNDKEVTMKDIPEAVGNSFKHAYKDVKVAWKKVGNEFEGAFTDNDKHTYVIYDANGKLVRTEVDVKESDLPAGVVTYKKDKKITMYSDTRRVTTGDVVTYRVKSGDEIIYFDSNGNYVKTVKM